MNGKWWISLKCQISELSPVWPDWAIYCTLGNFLKPVATIITQIAHILGNFGEGGVIFHFSAEIIYWATFIDIWQLFNGHTGCDENKCPSLFIRRMLIICPELYI